jgi:hypothetical protein
VIEPKKWVKSGWIAVGIVGIVLLLIGGGFITYLR